MSYQKKNNRPLHDELNKMFPSGYKGCPENEKCRGQEYHEKQWKRSWHPIGASCLE